MITISYDEKENIIYSERIGDITIQDTLQHILNLKKQFSECDCLYGVEVVGNSRILYLRDEYPVIFKSIEDIIQNFKEVRYAMIVKTPDETALSMIFEMLSASVDGFVFKTFTTMEAAVLWLKKGFYYYESLKQI